MNDRATVIDQGLNIRRGPNMNQPVIDQIKRGDKLTILEQGGHWYKVRPDNGSKTGWVHSSGLKFDAVLAPESSKLEPQDWPLPDVETPLPPAPPAAIKWWQDITPGWWAVLVIAVVIVVWTILGR